MKSVNRGAVTRSRAKKEVQFGARVDEQSATQPDDRPTELTGPYNGVEGATTEDDEGGVEGTVSCKPSLLGLIIFLLLLAGSFLAVVVGLSE